MPSARRSGVRRAQPSPGRRAVRTKPARRGRAVRPESGSARRSPIEDRLAIEREAGFRLLIETARPSTSRDVAARLERLRGRRPVVEPVHALAGRRRRTPETSFLVRFPGVSPADLEENPFDLAHQLRERSRGTFRRVEPDLPQAFREPDADALAEVGLSGGCWEPEAGPEDRFWHLRQMAVDAAWNLPPRPGGRARGAGIRIGHPDTGWTAHPEVEAALDKRSGFDYVDGDPDSRDPLGSSFFLRQPGHGTRTGSVIGARFAGALPPPAASGADDIAGVAPDATIVPIRCIRSVVIFYNSDVVRAIDHAVAAGCHVISMSLGGVGGSDLRRAVDRAVAANVIVCAAAGNCVGWVVEPASFASCIAVGGTNPDLVPWKGSSAGAKVAVSAPGTQVWTARPGAQGAPLAVRGQGTSFAVAAVAGVAALWLAHHGRDQLLATYGGRVPLQEVFRQLLRQTAQPVPPPFDPHRNGAGLVNAAALLAAPLPPVAQLSQPARLSRAAAAAEAPLHARIQQVLEPFGEPAAAGRLATALESTPAGAAADRRRRADQAEEELLALELGTIAHQHPNALRTLASGLQRAGAAGRMDWFAREGLQKYASRRLRGRLVQL